jgi:hypothetical protein
LKKALDDEYRPGVEDLFADFDGLSTDLKLNIDYYSEKFAGAALQTQELLNIVREPLIVVT